MNIGTLTGSVEIEDQVSGVLESIGHRVAQFAEHFEGALGGIAVGAGVVVGAVTAVTGAVVALGSKGSELIGIENAFDRLAEKAGTTGDALRSALTEGVKGTVDDTKLMESTMRLLGSGMKLTTDQALLMGQASRELGKATGGDAAGGLNILSMALTTGRTRALQQQIGLIDLKKGEEDFAKSLGKTKDQLGPLGVLEANRITILKATQTWLDKLGVSELSFKERIQQVGVALGQWKDDLAKAVATSPNVMHAFDAISDAIKSAFGGAGQTLLDNVVNWINRFADAVAKYAPPIIKWIGDIIDQVKAFYAKVVEYWDSVPDWFKKIALEAAITGGAIYATTETIHKFTAESESVRGHVTSLGESYYYTTHAISGMTTAVVEFNKYVMKVGILPMILGWADAIAAWAVTVGLSFASATVAVGMFFATLLANPFTWVAIGIAALVGGLRVLTGSWDFLLTPLKMAWQVLQDVWTVGGDLVEVLGETLTPVVDALKEAFRDAASLISDQFRMALQDARKDAEALWGVLKMFGPLADALDSIAFLHMLAEGSRIKKGIDAWEKQKQDLIDSMRKGSHEPAWDGSITARDPTPEEENPNLFKDTFGDKVKAMLKAWNEAGDGAKVFAAAFKTLNAAQLENLDIQQLLLPEILKLNEANKPVTAEMRDEANAIMDSAAALRAKGFNLLAIKGTTLEYVDQLKRMGFSEAEIAFKLDVTSDALKDRIKYLEDLKRLSPNLTSLTSLPGLGVADSDGKAFAAAQGSMFDTYKSYSDKVRQIGMSAKRLALDNIQIEHAAAIKSLGVRTRENMVFYDANKALMDHYYQHEVDLVNGTSGTIVERMRARGVLTQQDLRDIAAAEIKNYDDMVNAGETWSKRAIKQQGRVKDAAVNAAEGTMSAWDKTYRALDGISGILDEIPNKFAKLASEAVRDAGSILQAYETGGPVAAAIESIKVGVKWIGKLIVASREGRNAIKDFMNSFDTSAIGTGADELRDKLIGAGLEREWIKLTQTIANSDLSGAQKEIKFIQAALEALDNDIQHYNLTWNDLINRQAGGTKAGADLVASYRRLSLAGYDTDKILTAMSGDLNQFIVNSVKAGTKIPAALQPIIEKLIRTGQLTDAAARAMLGLADDTMPSLADIKDAADRYGLSLDSLGTKVQQLSLTEAANQIVKDFNLLTLAGADFNVIINGGDDAAKRMGTQIQDLVTKSLKLGLELPEAMKPIIQKMIDAGQLTDEFGQSLTDTTRLHFAVDLTKMFESLILKLDELIDKIGGVGGALSGLGNIEVRPTIKPRYDTSDLPEGTQVPTFSTGGIVPSYYATGKVINFAPRGTDTVPAMLTPGEEVLTPQQSKDYHSGQPSETTINVNFDGMVVDSDERAKQVVDGFIEVLEKKGARLTRVKKVLNLKRAG